ncbi:hypothetical protein [Arachidicoccus ginsenosidivorans]|nr:hypothetical protein [Arachidicoccus ginsenosidivorans]
MMQFGNDTAVLTDINYSSAVVDFVLRTRDQGPNSLAGMEFRNDNELI